MTTPGRVQTPEHEVVIEGMWHNDSTGGFAAQCKTCRMDLPLDNYREDGDDEMTFDALAAVVAEHRSAPVHEWAKGTKYSWFIYHPSSCWCGHGKDRPDV